MDNPEYVDFIKAYPPRIKDAIEKDTTRRYLIHMDFITFQDNGLGRFSPRIN